MKKLWLLLLMSNIAFGSIESYYCQSTNARQHGMQLYSEMELRFDYVDEENQIFLEDVVGSVKVSYEENLATDELYFGIFHFNEIYYNANYKPSRYQGYVQFPNFNSYSSNNYDGGGIWGELVVENNSNKEIKKAHYIFQAGDHMGGTIDLICKKQ